MDLIIRFSPTFTMDRDQMIRVGAKNRIDLWLHRFFEKEYHLLTMNLFRAKSGVACPEKDAMTRDQFLYFFDLVSIKLSNNIHGLRLKRPKSSDFPECLPRITFSQHWGLNLFRVDKRDLRDAYERYLFDRLALVDDMKPYRVLEERLLSL